MDIDECALRGALRATKPSSRIHFVVADFDVGLPILERSISLAIVVHVVSPGLLSMVCGTMVIGGYLIYETYGGNGGNYLALPRPGQIAAELRANFDFVYYKETLAGPANEAVTVRCLARRLR